MPWNMSISTKKPKERKKKKVFQAKQHDTEDIKKGEQRKLSVAFSE
jgi:hypothetical protein